MWFGSLVLGLLIGLVSGAIAYWLLDCGFWASILGFMLSANLVAMAAVIWTARRR